MFDCFHCSEGKFVTGWQVLNLRIKRYAIAFNLHVLRVMITTRLVLSRSSLGRRLCEVLTPSWWLAYNHGLWTDWWTSMPLNICAVIILFPLWSSSHLLTSQLLIDILDFSPHLSTGIHCESQSVDPAGRLRICCWQAPLNKFKLQEPPWPSTLWQVTTR